MTLHRCENLYLVKEVPAYIGHRITKYGTMIDIAHPVKYRAIILNAYN